MVDKATEMAKDLLEVVTEEHGKARAVLEQGFQQGGPPGGGPQGFNGMQPGQGWGPQHQQQGQQGGYGGQQQQPYQGGYQVSSLSPLLLALGEYRSSSSSISNSNRPTALASLLLFLPAKLLLLPLRTLDLSLLPRVVFRLSRLVARLLPSNGRLTGTRSTPPVKLTTLSTGSRLRRLSPLFANLLSFS